MNTPQEIAREAAEQLEARIRVDCNMPQFSGVDEISSVILSAITKARPAFDYTPWVPPFSYDANGTRIVDSKERLILDVRGWGFLTGKCSEALGMNEEKACVIQDAIGEHVTKLLNLTFVPCVMKEMEQRAP